MDLENVKRTKAIFDALSPEAQAEMKADALTVKGYLAKAFPAVPETDQAAFAYFMAETLEGLRQAPVARMSKILEDSAAAYGIAAIDLLGWADE